METKERAPHALAEAAFRLLDTGHYTRVLIEAEGTDGKGFSFEAATQDSHRGKLRHAPEPADAA